MKLLIITKKTLILLLLSCCTFVACDNGKADRERRIKELSLRQDQEFKEIQEKRKNCITKRMIISHQVTYTKYFEPIYHATIKNIYNKEITNIIFCFSLSNYPNETRTNLAINIQPQSSTQAEFEIVLQGYDKKNISTVRIEAIRFSDGSVEEIEALYNHKAIDY